jgi:hypothetical protein
LIVTLSAIRLTVAASIRATIASKGLAIELNQYGGAFAPAACQAFPAGVAPVASSCTFRF